MRYDRNFQSLKRTAGALVTPSPLLLCSFPCGISRIACCLPLSFECTFAFGLLGRLTRRHFGSNTLRLESHPKTDALQIVEVRERVEEFVPSLGVQGSWQVFGTNGRTARPASA